jgi:hypothetical protein
MHFLAKLHALLILILIIFPALLRCIEREHKSEQRQEKAHKEFIERHLKEKAQQAAYGHPITSDDATGLDIYETYWKDSTYEHW